jgi:hypothetical protein
MPGHRVILVSNDIVPGCGLPVAAPGLRVYGLATGLLARGLSVTTIVMRGMVDRQWHSPVPPAMARDTLALTASSLADYLRTQAPAVVVLTNSNQIDHVAQEDGNRYVLDFFAPKLLELVYEVGPDAPYPLEQLHALRGRKLRGIERADGFIVNGEKKLPYFLAWILQTDRDVRTLAFEHVGMCLPRSFGDQAPAAHGGPVRFAVAGYLQGWSVPGQWLRALMPLLADRRCTLDAMLPEHWAGASGFANPELDRLVAANRINVHQAKPFDEFRALLSECDVVLDLFDRTRERELAVVTRTIVALCAGKPVVHPPFTEVAPLIDAYDAGWLVDPADERRVAAALEEIASNPELVAAKARNARALWSARLDPAVAVEGLIRVIDRITAEPAAG